MIAGIPFLFKTRLQTRREESLESIGKFNVKFSDVVFGYSEIRVQQIGKAIDRIVNKASKESIDKEIAFQKTEAWSEIVIGTVSFLGTFLIIILGGYQVCQENMNIGGLFAAVQLSDQLVMPIIGISTSLNAVIASGKVRERLLEYQSKKNDVNIKASQPIIQNVTAKDLKTITIDNLTLKLGERYLFKNYSQKFEKSKKYLIVGQNGSGKSSLVRLIANDLTRKNVEISGKIQINGMEREKVADAELFHQLTIVPQVPYLFAGTVKDNLTLFGSLSEKNLENLSCLLDENMWKLIRDERIVSNESTYVSNGEREKIALLRGLLKGTKWFVLDEATAALDKKSKKEFEEYLLNRSDLTLIHISHNYNEKDKEKYDEVIRIGEWND